MLNTQQDQFLINKYLDNQVLYCAIGASIMMEISLKSFSTVICEKAAIGDPSGERSGLEDLYLSQLNAGQLFAMMSTVNSVLKLDFAPGDIAVMASTLAISWTHFRSASTGLLAITKSRDTILRLGGMYDTPTQIIYMIAFAWMKRDVPPLFRDNPFDIETMKAHGLPEIVRATLESLNVPYSNEDFASKMRNALDLLIMQNPDNWLASYSCFAYWDVMLAGIGVNT